MIISCNSENHIRTYRLPKKAKGAPIQLDNKNDIYILKWEKPDSWEQFDGHAMRMASFYVPYSGGKGEVSITEFSGMSGGIEANINRWRRQISLPPESIENIMRSSSSYKGRMGAFIFFELVNKKTNQAILASIFQLESRTVFIKLSIDQSGLDVVTSDFLLFSKSIFEQK